MISLIRTLINITLLRASPQNLIHSRQLLVVLLSLALLLSVLLFRINNNEEYDLRELLIFAYYVFMPLIILRHFGLPERYVQTMTAIAGKSILIALVILPLAIQLKTQTGLSQPPSQLLITVYWLLLLWSFVVEAHIYGHALNRSFHFGMVITLSLFFGDLLIRFVIYQPGIEA